MNAIPDPDDMAPGASTALVPAQAEIERIVEDRDKALALMRAAGEAVIAARQQVSEAAAIGRRATLGHHFYGHEGEATKRLFADELDLEKSLGEYRKNLDASIWSGLVERTGLRQMMDRTEAERFDRSLQEDVPEVTVDNIVATFERLAGDADLIFARGLARAFIELDERFKSHDAFKIGTRLILTNFFDEYGSLSYSGRAQHTLTDIERVFAILDGGAPDGIGLCDKIRRERSHGHDPRQSTTEWGYFRVKGYMNGNAHLWMIRDDLVEKVNKVLAAYYGEVLPDAVEPEDASEERIDLFRTGRSVSRDLQFYPTPPEAAAELLRDLHLDGKRILEPSAGEGGICRAILKDIGDRHRERHQRWQMWEREKGKPAPTLDRPRITAVEVHPDRCDAIRRLDGVDVIEANFLEWPAAGEGYDFVLMNPPFYGTHWMKHVRHAFDHLKPGGCLRAILPVTARLGESKDHLAFRRWAEKHARRYGRQWRDLPAESFASSGTRINTTILEIWK